MKIKHGKTLITLIIFSLLSCLIIAGCNVAQENGEPKPTLETPTVYRIGNVFSWNAIDKANKYQVSFGGGENYITDTVCRVKDIEKGGTLSIKAVDITADGKIKKQSAKVEIKLDAISETSTKYKEYQLSDYDIIIPAEVEKAVIVGDGESHGADILIDTRTKPLIVELYDVNCYFFGLKYDDDNGADQCVIVRSLGNEGSSFKGVSGLAGATGATGGGLLGTGGKGGNGTAGGIAGKFNYVVFEGDKPITFRGGSGGSGGTGGVANGWNTSGGDGGDGGSGGTGLSASNAYVAINGAELICAGGSGGIGGEGGYGKFAGMDSGDKGRNGSKGADFIGNKTEARTYPVIEKSAPANEGGENGAEQNALVGVYKLFSISYGSEIREVGDATDDGDVLSENDMVVTVKADGTGLTVTAETGKEVGFNWEVGGNIILFTFEDGSFVRAKLEGNVLTLTDGEYTFVLKRG